MPFLLRVQDHRAEFPLQEWHALLSRNAQLENRRPRRINFYCERDEAEQRRKQNQCCQAYGPIKRALYAELDRPHYTSSSVLAAFGTPPNMPDPARSRKRARSPAHGD